MKVLSFNIKSDIIIKPINYIGGIKMTTGKTLAIIIALAAVIGGVVYAKRSLSLLEMDEFV